MNKDQAAALRKPFPKESIGKLPKAGIQLDYVGHAATTDRLLSVDPDWTWEPAAVDETGLPILGPGKGMWIKLTVCGVTRYGYGDGPTVKEIIGDAIRNAAMRFGVALDLWSKEELEQVHGPVIQTSGAAPDVASAPPSGAATPDVQSEAAPEPVLLNTSSKLAKAMYAAIHEAGIPEATRIAYICEVIGRSIASTKEMTEAEARMVLDDLPNLEDSA